MIKQSLKHLVELGLQKNEAQVYLACLQRPLGLFVHQIQTVTEIKRSTIDLLLQRLRKMGYISRYRHGKRWAYCAESPERISLSMKEKLTAFNEFIPSLLSKLQDQKSSYVHFYEGVDGIEQIFDDILLTCHRLPVPDNELFIISSGKDLITLLPDHYKQFIRKRIRNGIPAKILAPDNLHSHKLYPESKAQLRQTRFFNEKEFPFQIEIDIYGNKVALINFSSLQTIGTVIENEAIALSMRSIFQMLWNFSQNSRKE
jgi:sugar-specific transcriptional regulator TrmB